MFLLIVAACASNKESFVDGDSAGSTSDASPSDPSATTNGDTDAVPDTAVPVWLAFDADFVVVEGIPDVASTLTWTLLDVAEANL